MSLHLSNSSTGSAQPLALHLVEEISHRVINEYAEAVAILSLAASCRHAPAGSALSQAADRLRAHADSHRALLAPLADGPVELSCYIGRLCASLSRASLEERGIHLSLSTDEIWVDSARCWRVGLIVAELIRNAVRHGLQGRPGAIGVDVRSKGARIRCIVSDDGGATTNPPAGRGRRLVRALAMELHGSANWWFTRFGTIAELDFPADQPGRLPRRASDPF
jgi:two-component sensor histidine kinase